jgi:CheY-like chemotaxis protein
MTGGHDGVFMQPVRSLRIFHLEDEYILRDIVRTTLLLLDPFIEIHQCEDSDEAVCHIEAHGTTFDLFLLDVRVPGLLDGIGVGHRLRELGCKGMIAFTSAYAAPDMRTMAVLDYVWHSKPVDLNRMRGILAQARDRAAKRLPPTDTPSGAPSQP